MLAIMLHELPDDLHCACISRTLPPEELTELTFKGQLDRPRSDRSLQFSEREARALVESAHRARVRVDGCLRCARLGGGPGAARRSCCRGRPRAEMPRPSDSRTGRTAVFAALARQLFDALTAEEQEALLKLSLLPEITPDLVNDLTGRGGRADACSTRFISGSCSSPAVDTPQRLSFARPAARLPSEPSRTRTSRTRELSDAA